MRKILLKLFLLILVKLFLSSNLLSQDQSYVSFSIGASIPVSPFSDNNTKNRNAGLAKTGGTLSLKYGRRIAKEELGVGFLLRASINGLNTNAMIDSYYDSNPQPRMNWQKKVSGWREISFLPGITYTFSLDKKIQMESGLYIGTAYAKSPEYILDGKGSGNDFGRNFDKDVTFIQHQVNAFAFSASLQSGFMYSINKTLSIDIGVEYHYLKPTFKDVEQISYGQTIVEPGGPANTSIFHYESRLSIPQNMNTININGGLIYKF